MIRSTDKTVGAQPNGGTASNGHPVEKRIGPNIDKHFVGLYQRLLGFQNGTARSPRTIGVTSCHRGEGVSTVATGLAVCAAQLGGGPAVLVDANLANPSVSRTFGVPAEPGLFDVLSGTLQPGECVRPSKCAGLCVLPSGFRAPGVESVYAPSAVAALVAELQKTYAMIVFDLPTAEECSPASIVGSALDGVVFVVEADRVDDALARRATLRLQRENVAVLGVVLNKRK